MFWLRNKKIIFLLRTFTSVTNVLHFDVGVGVWVYVKGILMYIDITTVALIGEWQMTHFTYLFKKNKHLCCFPNT